MKKLLALAALALAIPASSSPLMFGSRLEMTYRVTIAHSPGIGDSEGRAGAATGLSGFGTFGTINPIITWKNRQIAVLYSDPSTGSSRSDFRVAIAHGGATIPQDDFITVIVEDGSGVLRTFHTASADAFTTGASSNQWQWGEGANRVWTSADAGEIRSVRIISR